MDNLNPHAAILASPGMGHLIPILELGKRLFNHHNFKVTIFVVSSHTSPAESQLLHSSTTPPNFLNIVELPHVDISHLVPPEANFVTKLVVMMRQARPTIRTAISSMQNRPTALIVDFFGTEFLGIADEFEMLKYVFILPSAWFLALTIYTPTLDKLVKGEYVDQNEPLQIPGCKPIRPEDLVDPMLDRTARQYLECIRFGNAIPTGDGILVNTWEDLEPVTLGALREHKILSRIARVPLYPVGPLVRSVRPLGTRSELLDWLDMKPTESVIYVSFGSGGMLSIEQTTELAWGLEESQQTFIWVVRPPIENDASAFFFSAGSGREDAILRYLPEGFLNRTGEKGVVVPLWAPQVEILSHPSVGGFLSHCGWNSTLESITNGVPMIAWPLYAEQRMNATMLTEELGVAVRPKELPSTKVVGREEIGMMVRRVMEKDGNAMRDRIKKLQDNAAKSLGEGGSSYNSLSQLAKDIQKSHKSGKGF